MIPPRRRGSVSTLAAGVVWTALAAVLSAWALAVAAPLAALVAFVVATLLLWVTGLRAAALWGRAATWTPLAVPAGAAPPLRIALVYCVADDVDVAAIAASMRQDVAVQTVILDDSHDDLARAAIDVFAETHGCHVIRRHDRSGFKAGNLNNGLAQLRGRFDAYLVCDSDVVLAPEVARTCARALADPTVAVAQAAPAARAGRTWFARYFGPLLGTHIAVTRRGREAQGIVTFLGRGALIRAAALDDVGGFPEAVAEDLALTLALGRRGWRLVNVEAEFTEDYPVDYRSFRTQLRKTTEGAVELLGSHARAGRVRGLRLREAGDLLLEAALVPTAALAGVAALVAGAVLAAHGAPPPLWVALAATVSAAMPLAPEAVRRARTRSLAAGVVFTLVGGALYASTMFVVLGAVLRTLLGGRAVFWITPKAPARLGVRQALELLRPELTLVPVVAAAAAIAAGSPLFALAPFAPVALALAFSAPALRGTAGPWHPAAEAATRVRLRLPLLVRRMRAPSGRRLRRTVRI